MISLRRRSKRKIVNVSEFSYDTVHHDLRDAPLETDEKCVFINSIHPPSPSRHLHMSTQLNSQSHSITLKSRKNPHIVKNIAKDSNNLCRYVQQAQIDEYWTQTIKTQWHKSAIEKFKLANDREICGNHHAAVNRIDVDNVEQRYMLACSNDGIISMYDTSKKRAKPMRVNEWQQFHNGKAVNTVQWWPFDTGIFISGASDGQVAIWDTNALTVATSFNLNSAVYEAQVSTIASAHTLIAAVTENVHVRLCDIKSGALVQSLIGHSEPVRTVCWSPISEWTLASGSEDGTIRTWDIRKANGTEMILDYTNEESAFVNSIVQFRNLRYRNIRSHTGFVSFLRWTHDGKRLVSIGSERDMRLWDIVTGKNMLVSYQGITKMQGRRAFDLDDSDSYVFLANAEEINIYDLQTGQLIKRLRSHFNKVSTVRFDSNADRLYSGSEDHMILVWHSHIRKQRGDMAIPLPRGRLNINLNSEYEHIVTQPDNDLDAPE